MPGAISQRLFVPGSRALFTPDNAIAPLDLGTITPANPQLTSQQIQMRDSWPGRGTRVIIDERTTEQDESYQFTCSNFSGENWNLILSGDGLQDFSQAATPVVDERHECDADRPLVALRLASGARAYSIASIQGIEVDDGSGDPSGVALDPSLYRLYDPTIGLVELLDTSVLVDDGTGKTPLYISFTPTAIASEKRLVRPQKLGQVAGTLELWWAAGSDQEFVRTFRANLTTAQTAIQDTDYSNFQLNARVLSNPLDTVVPAGTMLNLGAVLRNS